MKELGTIIFLIFIVAQGVAAVVTSLKKRQAEAERKQAEDLSTDAPSRAADGPLRARPKPEAPPVSSTPAPSPTSARDELVARRRAQIEELRRQAAARKAGGRVAPTVPQGTQAGPTARPTAPTPVQAPTVRRVPGVTGRVAPPPSAAPPSKPEPAPASNPAGSAPKPAAAPLAYEWSAKAHPDTVEGAPLPLKQALRSRRRLRQLVVMREVLDPPLALRPEPPSAG